MSFLRRQSAERSRKLCVVCGVKPVQTMGVHRGTKAHLVAVVKRSMALRGYRRAGPGGVYATIVGTRVELLAIRDAAYVQKDSNARADKITEGWWVPAWAYAIASHNIAADPCDGQPIAERRALLNWLADHPEEQVLAAVVVALAGPSGYLAHVQEAMLRNP